MPSTVVHLGLAALIAAALLDDRFDGRALAVVLLAVAIPDLDTVLGLWWDGAHRAVLHNLWVVALPALALVLDTRLRRRSWLRGRWGDRGVRVAWVALVATLLAQIALDAFFNGANLLYPVHDAFIDLSGEVYVSNREGLVQTFVDLGDPEGAVRGTTEDVHYRTGVDPAPRGESDAGHERRFPIADDGMLFVVMASGYLVAGYRLLAGRSDR
ncbi:MAG: metal-dependent hydrolase [Halobacteriales archaeon]